MAGFSDAPYIQGIAVPAVCLLITFLGYFSQYVFHFSTTLDPGPPSRTETIIFNTLLVILYYTYYKAVTVDPGRYVFPEQVIEVDSKRWCKKCEAPKPPRAHHCRLCQRCIPKMDHHCPWTRNCVSMTTFPHFLRFLVYTNMSLWTLGYLLWQRFQALWDSRHLPAYLGPSMRALIALSVISILNFLTSVALGIMLITTVKSWLLNQTIIEGWEYDRHQAVAERGGRDWWDVVGPDGETLRFEKIEFPYDIGFFSNMAQAMGTSNFLSWFFPFAGHPKVDKKGKGAGWTWEENGFNRKEGMWPPLDPEKIRRAARAWPAARRDYEAELMELELELDANPDQQKEAFKARQDADLRRRKLLDELEEHGNETGYPDDGYDDEDDNADAAHSSAFAGGKEWTNSDGERLWDYGVDEDTETGADDDVPLAELLRRRRAHHQANDES